MSLNAALLALSGACVYSLLQWRAAKLPAAEQTILREQVLVARGSAKEASNAAAIESETERILQDRLKSNPVDAADVPEVRKQIRELVRADFQLVPPGYSRQWRIDLGFARDFLQGQTAATAGEIQLGAKKPFRRLLRVMAGGGAGENQVLADDGADEPGTGHVP